MRCPLLNLNLRFLVFLSPLLFLFLVSVTACTPSSCRFFGKKQFSTVATSALISNGKIERINGFLDWTLIRTSVKDTLTWLWILISVVSPTKILTLKTIWERVKELRSVENREWKHTLLHLCFTLVYHASPTLLLSFLLEPHCMSFLALHDFVRSLFDIFLVSI